MTSSKAFLSGFSLQDVCDVVGWTSLLTFVRFYNLNLGTTPGSQVLLS